MDFEEEERIIHLMMDRNKRELDGERPKGYVLVKDAQVKLRRKECASERVCLKHRAIVKRCSSEGCTRATFWRFPPPSFYFMLLFCVSARSRQLQLSRARVALLISLALIDAV